MILFVRCQYDTCLPHHIPFGTSKNRPYTNRSIIFEAFLLILFVRCAILSGKSIISHIELVKNEILDMEIEISMSNISLGEIWYFNHAHHRATNNESIFQWSKTIYVCVFRKIVIPKNIQILQSKTILFDKDPAKIRQRS